MVFRNGDLTDIPDAAELIDSAQDAAKILAQRCADKDAEIAALVAEVDALQRRGLAQSAVEVEHLEEIARLREAIKAWDRYIRETTNLDPFDPMTDFPPEEMVLFEIAREGR